MVEHDIGMGQQVFAAGCTRKDGDAQHACGLCGMHVMSAVSNHGRCRGGQSHLSGNAEQHAGGWLGAKAAVKPGNGLEMVNHSGGLQLGAG